MNELMNERTCFMEKKVYINPQTSVENYHSVLMYVSGPASAAPDPHASGAPANPKKTEVF